VPWSKENAPKVFVFGFQIEMETVHSALKVGTLGME